MIEKHNVGQIEKIFTVFLSLAVILNGYASGIGSLSIGMVLFAFFVIITALNISRQCRFPLYSLLPTLFFVLMLFNTLIESLCLDQTYFNGRNTINSIIRLFIWAISTSFMSILMVDYNLYWKWMHKVAAVSSLYVIIQTIALYLLHIVLPSVFIIGPLRPNYDIYEYSQLTKSGFRPSGFFAEPSFLAYFLIINLVHLLFSKEDIEDRSKLTFIVLIGLFFSTSSSGIYIALIVLSLFFIYKTEGKSKIIAYFIMIAVVLSGWTLFGNINWSQVRTGIFGNTFGYALSKINTLSNSGRVGKSFAYLESLEKKDWIFGVGFGNEASYIMKSKTINGLYMNSITSLIINGGLFGMSLFLLMNAFYFTKTKNVCCKILIGIYVFCGYFSGIYFSIHGIMYLITIIVLIKHEIKEKGEVVDLYERKS